jgi:hypothetical protein
MKRNNTSQILLLIAVVSLIFTGCGSSASSNTKIKKLELTEENVKKVFSDKYELLVVSIYGKNKGISGGFIPKEDIPKNKGKEKLEEIENTLQKNFNIGNENNIEILNDNKNGSHRITVIKKFHGKIQIGTIPFFGFNGTPHTEILKYSMSTKFNLLNPYKDITLIATDEEDGNITSKIKLKNPEVLSKIGVNSLIYEVMDSDNNTVTDNSLKIEVTK